MANNGWWEPHRPTSVGSARCLAMQFGFPTWVAARQSERASFDVDRCPAPCAESTEVSCPTHPTTGRRAAEVGRAEERVGRTVCRLLANCKSRRAGRRWVTGRLRSGHARDLQSAARSPQPAPIRRRVQSDASADCHHARMHTCVETSRQQSSGRTGVHSRMLRARPLRNASERFTAGWGRCFLFLFSPSVVPPPPSVSCCPARIGRIAANAHTQPAVRGRLRRGYMEHMRMPRHRMEATSERGAAAAAVVGLSTTSIPKPTDTAHVPHPPHSPLSEVRASEGELQTHVCSRVLYIRARCILLHSSFVLFVTTLTRSILLGSASGYLPGWNPAMIQWGRMR